MSDITKSEKQLCTLINQNVLSDPILSKLQNLPSNNTSNTIARLDNDLEKSNISSKYNPITGIMEEDTSKKNINHEYINFDEIIDAANNNKIDIDTVELSADLLHKSLLEDYHIKENDVDNMINLIYQYRKNNKINVYNKLPVYMQEFINKQFINNNLDPSLRNIFAKELIDTIIRDCALDKVFIDFNNELNNIISTEAPSLLSNYVQNAISYKSRLYTIADKLEKEHLDKAQLFKNIGDAAEEAYTYAKFKNAIINHTFKIKKINLEKSKKVYTSFNNKYINSKLNINDVSMTVNVLYRIFNSEYTIDDIELFIVAFCIYSNKFSPLNLAEHTFMYYFISHILTIELYRANDDVSNNFYNKLLENIKDTIKLLKNGGYGHERKICKTV